MARERTRTETKGAAALSHASANLKPLSVTVLSFGYKAGPPPVANMIFDVRFLKNPFWVEELRPLTGLDQQVQDYVLSQRPAQDFLESMLGLLELVLPKVAEHKVERYVIALGCTGGQHRSPTLAESLGAGIRQRLPGYDVVVVHRELAQAIRGCCAEKDGAKAR